MLLVAQALVERGMLDAMVAGVQRGLMLLEVWVGVGNGKWVLAGVGLALAVLFFRSRH